MPTRQSRLYGWQLLTVLLLLFGYSGYYLCRSNFSVALPMIVGELARSGLSSEIARIRLGSIASLGVAAYAIGKFPAGAMADYFGGRRNFLGGMAGAVFFTLLFSLSGGLPLFTLAWVGNRLAQSSGWAGIVKISSRWFSYRTYGTVMAILSLSFLFGDAASRAFLASLWLRPQPYFRCSSSISFCLKKPLWRSENPNPRPIRGPSSSKQTTSPRAMICGPSCSHFFSTPVSGWCVLFRSPLLSCEKPSISGLPPTSCKWLASAQPMPRARAHCFLCSVDFQFCCQGS